MKTCFTLLIGFLFCCAVQAQEDVYAKQFKLAKTWITPAEGAWIFDQNSSLKIVENYQEWNYFIMGDTLEINYYEADNGYLDEKESGPIVHLFRICKLTNDALFLQPLNSNAIGLVDFNLGQYQDARTTLYKSYLKELKIAGKDSKKRNLIISNYKTNHKLYVDTVKFASQSYYFEPIKIDSVDVSLYWKETLENNIQRKQFNDLRWVVASNTYYFGYRFKDSKIPTAQKSEVLEFIPPLVFDSEFEEEPVSKLSAHDSLMIVLNEAPAGWYMGKFNQTGSLLLELSLQTYGLSKAHPIGSKNSSDHQIRVYHDGTYTDFYRNRSDDTSYLLSHLYDFIDNWSSYVDTFQPVGNKKIVFEIGLE